MAKERPKRKLFPDEQVQVCKWLAQMYNSREVADLVKEHFGKDITYQNIHDSYLKALKWKPIIEKFHKDFLENFEGIPIANKAVRLQYYQKVYRHAMTWYVAGYSADGTPIEKLCLGAANQAIEGARREREGDKPLVQQTFITQVIKEVSGGNGELSRSELRAEKSLY